MTEIEFVLFTPLAPYEVPMAINKLCEGYNAAVSAQDIDAFNTYTNIHT